jgi:tetraacyldisaccharide 4'-kinase
LRHFCFDHGWFKSAPGSLPTIVIGNLNLGGTGKTPFTLMLLKSLENEYRLGFLSRGYGRKTKGFAKITASSLSEEVGDEPLLISQHMPMTPCFVGENRISALEKIKAHHPALEWVLLDDAFQHRPLQPQLSLLLTRWNKPYFEDQLWPVGNLRDIPKAANRAHALVVTSTPREVSVLELENKRKKIALYFKGPIFFAQTHYLDPRPLFPENDVEIQSPVGAFCGIAQPEPFFQYVDQLLGLEKKLTFADHHTYSNEDLKKLSLEMVNFDGKIKTWVTTEKDAMRIRHLEQWKSLPIFYIPIETKIHSEDQAQWNQWLKRQLKK